MAINIYFILFMRVALACVCVDWDPTSKHGIDAMKSKMVTFYDKQTLAGAKLSLMFCNEFNQW